MAIYKVDIMMAMVTAAELRDTARGMDITHALVARTRDGVDAARDMVAMEAKDGPEVVVAVGADVLMADTEADGVDMAVDTDLEKAIAVGREVLVVTEAMVGTEAEGMAVTAVTTREATVEAMAETLVTTKETILEAIVTTADTSVDIAANGNYHDQLK